MSFWIIILGLTFLVAGIGFLYLVSRVGKFSFIDKLSKGKKGLRRFLSFGILLVVFGITSLIFDFFNSIIIVLNLMLVWLIVDGIAVIIKHLKKSKDVSTEGEEKGHPYYVGIIAIVFTFAYLCLGYYLAHNVWVTNYEIDSPKIDGESLRVVMFADAHIGTTFDGDGFAKEMELVQDQNPDVVLICGDLADDGTTIEEMQKASESLGKLETTYGVYYVFGNHDKGLGSRSYGGNLVTDLLSDNNVHVLQDEEVQINDTYVIIGRQDRSTEQYGNGHRMTMGELTENVDKDLFSIVMDHQPGDFDAQAEAGVDLVFCGHTHAGQMIPITYVGEWFGMNDSTYGIERRKDTTFVTTSGISDWEFMFKTGCKSEIVVMDIH